MSAAGKARIVAAQKARWAKLKGAKQEVKTTTVAVKQVVAGKVPQLAKKKFTMSAEAKAKISAAAKVSDLRQSRRLEIA
jgi:hypothetical protein